MWRNFDYIESLPREMQRLGQSLCRAHIRPVRLARDFERVVSRASFDKHRAAWLCERLMSCHVPSMVGTCLDLLREKAPDHLPSAKFFSNSLIQSRNYKLTPVLNHRGLATSLISENDRNGVLYEIHRQWTYPEVFFPDIFQTELNIRIFANTIMGQSDTVARDLLQKIVKIPMHENACKVFTGVMIDQAGDTYGKIRLSHILTDANRGIGGILMQANLFDGARLLQSYQDDPVIETIVRESEALALHLDTPEPVSPPQRRLRL